MHCSACSSGKDLGPPAAVSWTLPQTARRIPFRLVFLLRGAFLTRTEGFFPMPTLLAMCRVACSPALCCRAYPELYPFPRPDPHLNHNPWWQLGEAFQECAHISYFEVPFLLLLCLSGLFVGCSSAMNCVGAVLAARRLRPAQEGAKAVKVVTVLCDSGSRGVSRQVGFFSKTFAFFLCSEGVIICYFRLCLLLV